MIDLHYTNLETCAGSTGPVVVIDVLRAFTTACFAFEAGAEQILLAGSVEQALALRQRFPGSLLMGEVDGLPVEGFDFSNSPHQVSSADLHNRTLIHRTSAGTQGVVRSPNASPLLVGSFVCARATANYLRRHLERSGGEAVSFVVTGILGPRDGDEDAACAEYMAACLVGAPPDPQPYLERVLRSYSGQLFANPARPEFPRADLDLALQVDRFDFALPVRREGDLLVVRPERVGGPAGECDIISLSRG